MNDCSVVTKKPRVVSYCDEETYEVLKAIAEDEGRSLSRLVEILLQEMAELKPILDSARNDPAWRGLPFTAKLRVLIEEQKNAADDSDQK